MKTISSNRIQVLNDKFRQTLIGGRVVMTAGVAAMADEDRRALIDRARRFDEFTPENDPYGEHDFGSIDLGGSRYFWKIDYYDATLTCGSADASDAAATERVLTLMRADELSWHTCHEAAQRAKLAVYGQFRQSSNKQIKISYCAASSGDRSNGTKAKNNLFAAFSTTTALRPQAGH
ncbi:DUF3768 domain-containing protein [Hoeflea alexandrii]